MFSCGSLPCNNPLGACRVFSRPGISMNSTCTHGFDDCSCFVPCAGSQFAYLIQSDPMTLVAGDHVPFAGQSLLSGGLSLSNGMLSLTAPGVYRVEYQINVPTGSCVYTVAVVCVNGQDIAGSQRTIVSTVASPAQTITAQAIFEVDQAATLSLDMVNAVSLSPAFIGDAVATMTLVGLC